MQEMKVIFNRKYLIKLVLPLVVEQILAVTVGMADGSAGKFQFSDDR